MSLSKKPFFYELFFRFLYCVIAFVLCFSICYWKNDLYLTFLTYPYLKLNAFKRLIALNVSELFSLSIYISNTVSLILVYPFFFAQIRFFFINAWFKEQVNDLTFLNTTFWVLFTLCFYLCYEIFIPLISLFLLELNPETHKGMLILELEPRITNYLEWIFPFLFIVSNFIPCTILLLLFVILNVNQKGLLLNLIKYRKIIALLIISTSSALLPITLYWQFFLFVICFCFFEFLLFCCCWYK